MSEKLAPAHVAAAPVRRVAVTAARVPQLARKCGCSPSETNCKCDESEKKPLQRKATGSGGTVQSIPPIVNQVLASPGCPLDTGTRSYFESRFGHDFGGVRVHTGYEAGESARAVGAHAYTVGNDIVFGHGRFDPSSNGGRRLIAHELTHTLQQQGMQHSSDGSGLSHSTPGDVHEREADSIADAVVSGSEPARFDAHAPAHAPLLARDADPAAPPPPPPPPPAPAPAPAADAAAAAPGGAPAVPANAPAVPTPAGRSWTTLPAPINVGPGQQATARADLDPNTTAFRINQFNLPPQKGPVAQMYQERAAAGALEGTVRIEGSNARAGLWQQREPSSGLRDNWLLKVGWRPAEAGTKWHEAGGVAPTPNGFPNTNPRVTSTTCDMDHIVELQLGGTNVPSNIQVLNSAENQESGRQIWEQVRGIAQTLHGTLSPRPANVEIMLHFDSVSGGTGPQAANCAGPGAAPSCTSAELCAVSRSAAAAAPGTAGAATRERHTLVAGGATADVELLAAPSSTTLQNDTPANVAASELVPGAILRSVNRTGAANARDQVDACLESATCTKRTAARATRVPLSLAGTSSLPMEIFPDAQGRRHLRFRGNQTPAVRFTYPYLSVGNMNLRIDEANGVVGTGTLRPSLPLLNRLEIQVRYGRGELAATVSVPPDKIRLPFPGTRITRAELGLELSPVFRPHGTVAFEIGPRGRPAVTGSINAEADQNGLVLRGDVFAHIPGVDNAQGHVEYRNRQWSGFIAIESTQIRLPNVRRGGLRVDFTSAGYDLSGGVTMDIAGNEVDLSVRRRQGDNAWIYTGAATINLRNMRPVRLEVTYDGRNVTARGRAEAEFQGLRGDVDVEYRNGAVTGTGTLAINRGRASGQLRVRRSAAGAWSGDGEVRYQINPNLIATAGIELREDRTVRLRGALEFPQPIRLFEGVNRQNELFRRSVDIPIAGVSLGPVSVGLIARITGAFGVSYGFGPGELRNARIAAAFNPLEENPALDLQMGARLVIPAHAGVYLSIRGAIGVSAGVASVTGGLTARGDAMLRGGLEAAVDVRYQQGRYAVDAVAEISAAPVLSLTLTADVTAEAGAFGLEYRTTREWRVAAFQYGSDLRFGLSAPIHYASNEPFRPPSLNDVRFTVPQIDVLGLVRTLMQRAAS